MSLSTDMEALLPWRRPQSLYSDIFSSACLLFLVSSIELLRQRTPSSLFPGHRKYLIWPKTFSKERNWSGSLKQTLCSQLWTCRCVLSLRRLESYIFAGRFSCSFSLIKVTSFRFVLNEDFYRLLYLQDGARQAIRQRRTQKGRPSSHQENDFTINKGKTVNQAI